MSSQIINSYHKLRNFLSSINPKLNLDFICDRALDTYYGSYNSEPKKLQEWETYGKLCLHFSGIHNVKFPSFLDTDEPIETLVEGLVEA